LNQRTWIERVVPVIAVPLVLFFWSVTALAGVNRWTSRGPEGASILSLAIDPTRPDILYAGTGSYSTGHYTASIIKSVDGGRTWAASGAGLTTGVIDQILIDPIDPDRVYAKAQAGDGMVFVSTNGGARWEPVVVTLPVYCLAAGRGPTQTVLYAGTARNGILKSTDGGASWSASGLAGFAFFAVFVDPTDANRAYASPGAFGGDSFRTDDGGATWQRLAGVSLLAMDPGHPHTLYATGAGTIRKSIDSGDTWSPTGPLTADPIFMAVDPADGNRLYLSTYESFWTSSDGGMAWGSTDNPVYFDSVTALAFDPRDPAVLHAGRRLTGPYRSADQGASFQAIHHGLALTDILALRTGSSRGGPLYADASPCPVDRSDDGGRTWCCVNPLLRGYVVAVDPVDPLTVYLSVEAGDSPLLNTSHDGGLSLAPLANPDASLQSQVVVHPKDPSVLYAYFPSLFRSGDGGASWTSISAGLPYAPAGSALSVLPPVAFDEVTSIAVDPRTPTTIYAASHHCLYAQNVPCAEPASALSRSVDAGRSWTTIPLPPGMTSSTQISTSPADPGAIYILADAAGAFRTRDDGASWTLLRATLGQLALDPSSPSVLYGIESDGGAVLRSTDGGFSWLPFGDGLEDVPVAGLFVDATGSVVRAATIGGGVREYEFGAARATLSTAPGEDFLISLEARDQRTGRTSAGLAVAHTDDFAWFSLPDLTQNIDNPEVFVKVVDGRAVNGNFWVFYGGLTDVEYTVSVTQESTSLLRTYSKAAGGACGAFDTEAFPPSDGPAPAAAPAAACAGDGDLFLSPGRSFTVELSATDPRTGRTTTGAAANENDSFGTFSLPAFTGNLSNPEVFVKMVDGRPVNGHFWIFYGGLTDVEYTLTVTDAVSGAVHTYEKPAGSSCGGFDTTTFSE
jgi:photosystem II stability/assembly factor-like uncharacterized protein